METGDLTKSIIGVAVVVIVIVTVAIPILGQFTKAGEAEIETNTTIGADGFYFYIFPMGTDFQITSDGATAGDVDISQGFVSLTARYADDQNYQGFCIRYESTGVTVWNQRSGSGSSGSSGSATITDDTIQSRVVGTPYLLISQNPEVPNGSIQYSAHCYYVTDSSHVTFDADMFADIGDTIFIASDYNGIVDGRNMRIQQATVNSAGDTLSFPGLYDDEVCTVDTDATGDESVGLTILNAYMPYNKDPVFILLAPAEYTKVSQTPAMIEGPVAEIVDIIPLIMVVGVLIGAVGLFVLNRRS